MKSRYSLVFFIFVLTVICSKCFADDIDGFPTGPGKELELSRLVGQALEWNHYWFGDWGKNFNKVVKIGKKKTVAVFFNKKEKSYNVFFDDLPAYLSFIEDGSWSAVDVLDDYQLAGHSNKQETDQYFDFKSSQYPMNSFDVVFDKSVLNILSFGSFDKEKCDFVSRLFLGKILMGDDLEFIQGKITKSAKSGIVIRVGNFSFNYPCLYYYIEGLSDDEGAPYLGWIYFDLKTRNLISEELASGDTPPTKRKYKNAINRIDQNGMTFRYKDGKFMAVK